MSIDWNNLPKESNIPTMEDKERDEDILQVKCFNYDFICEYCKLKNKTICGFEIFKSHENFKKDCHGYANTSECLYLKLV